LMCAYPENSTWEYRVLSRQRVARTCDVMNRCAWIDEFHFSCAYFLAVFAPTLNVS